MLLVKRLVEDLIFYHGLNLIKKNNTPNIIEIMDAPINEESTSEYAI